MSKKGGHDEEHINHEAWVIPYADLLTLLMAMFLALWATGNMDLAKMKALAKSMQQLGAGKGAEKVVDPNITSSAKDGVLSGAGLAWPINKIVDGLNGMEQQAGQAALDKVSQVANAAKAEQQQFDKAATDITKALDGAGLGGKYEIKKTSQGLDIVLLTDQLVFGSGSSNLESKGADAIAQLASSFKGLDNNIQVIGHTDSQGSVDKNMLLSQQRAMSVWNYLVYKMGLDPKKVSTSGVGPTQPIASNDTAAGRAMNRRVEIVVMSKVPDVSSEVLTSGASAADTAKDATAASDTKAAATTDGGN